MNMNMNMNIILVFPQCPSAGGKIYIPGYVGSLLCPPAAEFCRFETVSGEFKAVRVEVIHTIQCSDSYLH